MGDINPLPPCTRVRDFPPPRSNSFMDTAICLVIHSSLSRYDVMNKSCRLSSQTTICFSFSGQDGFAGYYSFFLPERCWDSKGVRLVSDENWGSERNVTCADIETKKVTKVTSGHNQQGAWLVLDVSHDLVVAQFSTPTSPPQLVSPCDL